MSEITKELSFEEKIIEKLRSDIGNLMTDEQLSKIIEKGVDKIFFANQEVKISWCDTKVVPSKFQQNVEKLLTERIEKITQDTVHKYLSENPELLSKIIADLLDMSMQDVVLKALASAFSAHLESAKFNIINDIQNSLIIRN